MSDLKMLSFPLCSRPRVNLVTVEQCWTVAEASVLRGPYEASAQLLPYFANKDREHFIVLHLDCGHRAISVDVVSVGTLNSAPVHPREVFKAAILANAAAIIAAHNHPSGGLDPSPEDLAIFQKLKQAGDLLGIKLLDFLIISGNEYRSLSEAWGLLPIR